jgi:hypothetical protein
MKIYKYPDCILYDIPPQIIVTCLSNKECVRLISELTANKGIVMYSTKEELQFIQDYLRLNNEYIIPIYTEDSFEEQDKRFFKEKE